MALAAHVWTSAIANLANGTLPLTNAGSGYRVMAFDASAADPAVNVNTDATMADVKTTMGAHEIGNGAGGSNYAQSGTVYNTGQALSSVTWTRSTNVWTFSAASPAWTTAGSGFAPAYAVFYYCPAGTPADSACLPVCWWNFLSGAAVPGAGGNYTLTVAASGICTITGTG